MLKSTIFYSRVMRRANMDGRYRDDGIVSDLIERIKSLEKRLSVVERTPQLENSALDRGSLTVYSGRGVILFMHNDGVVEFMRVGLTEGGFGPLDNFRLNYLDGGAMFFAQTNLFGFEQWLFRDSTGNNVLCVDPKDNGTSEGVGLGRPYLTTNFFTAGTPTDTTASGTFTTLQRCPWRKQHPNAEFWVRYNVTATTGEIQFTVAGIVIGGPVTIPNGSGTLYVSPFEIPGSHMDTMDIEAQCRVASGAGNVAVAVMGAGRERP
jgi:hypothetical protein